MSQSWLSPYSCEFISHNSVFMSNKSEFISHKSEFISEFGIARIEVRIMRYKLAIVSKGNIELWVLESREIKSD